MYIHEWWMKIFKNNHVEQQKAIEKAIKILESNKN